MVMTKDLPYLKGLVILNGLVPLAMLGWDAWQGQLGANAANTALHITGIVSLVFLILSLAMSPLLWWTGWGGWIAFRRALGLYAFLYAAAHLAIYVGFDRAMSLTSTIKEIVARRYLQVGALAFLLMIPLAVTSTNRMIQRLTSRRWKRLHQLSYVVAILAVLHFYMLVKSDVLQPVAFGCVVVGLLLLRVGRRPGPRTVRRPPPTTLNPES
jgi:sulfoxide reductase heme-binding subunit YedZ